MKKAKSDPSKPQTEANKEEARDLPEPEERLSDGDRRAEEEAAALEGPKPVKAESKGKRTKGAGQKKTAAPAAEGSAMTRFRRLWKEEMGEARSRAGKLWGRFRTKKYIRPKRGQVRQLIRSRFTYQELLGVLFALCPLVGVTGTVADGVAAGVISTLTVLGSAVIIELFRRILPGGMVSLCHMIIVAGFTTGLTLLLQAFAPQLVEELGIYLSMTVISCLALERQVAPSREQGTLFLLLDCIVTGLSFTLLLAAVSLLREFLGAGALFGFPVFGGTAPLPIMAGPFGGFFCVGCVAALTQALQLGRKKADPAAKGRRAA